MKNNSVLQFCSAAAIWCSGTAVVQCCSSAIERWCCCVAVLQCCGQIEIYPLLRCGKFGVRAPFLIIPEMLPLTQAPPRLSLPSILSPYTFSLLPTTYRISPFASNLLPLTSSPPPCPLSSLCGKKKGKGYHSFITNTSYE
jgi:hypothetical protein